MPTLTAKSALGTTYTATHPTTNVFCCDKCGKNFHTGAMVGKLKNKFPDHTSEYKLCYKCAVEVALFITQVQ